MASVADPSDVKDLISGEALTRARPDTRRMAILAGAVILVLIAVAFIAVSLTVQNRQEELRDNLRNRIEITALARADVIATWLDGFGNLADRLTRSDLFRLFAAEVGQDSGTTELPPALRRQLPYMQAVINEFAEQSGLSGAYLIGRDGRAYLASGNAPSLGIGQRQLAQSVFQNGLRTLSPIRPSERGLEFDVLFAIPAAQTLESDAGEPAGILLMTVPAANKLADVLSGGPLDQDGELTRLIQIADDAPVQVNLSEPFLTPVAEGAVTERGAPMPFAERTGLDGEKEVFSAGAPVIGTPWVVVREIDSDTALARLSTFRLTGIGIAVLSTLLIGAAFVAVWWRQHGEQNRALAVQYHELAAQIHAQRRLLDSINNAIEEGIGLKGSDGAYIYANPSLARMVGRSVEEVAGRRDDLLFGRDATVRLAAADDRVVASGSVVVTEETLALPAGQRHLTISKAPLRNDEGETIGIVSVARDVTEVVEHRQRIERAVAATISALASAVESHDRYLAGHSRRVATLCEGIARRLGLPDEDVATLRMAANLSQVGKLAVPDEIVSKEARLTAEEFAIMRQHIEHAEDTLKDVEFGLPVRETLVQMHERLDGSGYPRGLAADAITPLGRILAVADVYCARTAPRSYRETLTPIETVDILEANHDKYDPKVVEALRGQIEAVR